MMLLMYVTTAMSKSSNADVKERFLQRKREFQEKMRNKRTTHSPEADATVEMSA
jgi:hypothetical protein